MKKTVVITGASSGIGNATALYFAKKNWQVYATMRSIEKYKIEHQNIIPLVMDVADDTSIKNCRDAILNSASRINVLVNNAGYGGFGAFELSTHQQRKEMYDVNVFGTMQVIQEFLPNLRNENSGVIINISSIGGLMTYPLFSIYHSTKWAIEGFSESLYFELREAGVKVKIVEPGATKTDFSTRSLKIFENMEIDTYKNYQQRLFLSLKDAFKDAVEPEKVAKTIYEAACDNTYKLRYAVGNRRSLGMLHLRNLIPTSLFMALIKRAFTR